MIAEDQADAGHVYFRGPRASCRDELLSRTCLGSRGGSPPRLPHKTTWHWKLLESFARPSMPTERGAREIRHPMAPIRV